MRPFIDASVAFGPQPHLKAPLCTGKHFVAADLAAFDIKRGENVLIVQPQWIFRGITIRTDCGSNGVCIRQIRVGNLSIAVAKINTEGFDQLISEALIPARAFVSCAPVEMSTARVGEAISLILVNSGEPTKAKFWIDGVTVQ